MTGDNLTFVCYASTRRFIFLNINENFFREQRLCVARRVLVLLEADFLQNIAMEEPAPEEAPAAGDSTRSEPSAAEVVATLEQTLSALRLQIHFARDQIHQLSLAAPQPSTPSGRGSSAWARSRAGCRPSAAAHAALAGGAACRVVRAAFVRCVRAATGSQRAGARAAG